MIEVKRNLRIYPEDMVYNSKSNTTSCSTLPSARTRSESTKSGLMKVYNLGIMRSDTMGLQRKDPELEFAQLVPIPGPKVTKRRDRRGELIDKKAKKHHITFKDDVTGEQVAEITEVISYKKHYYYSDDRVEECSCRIL